MERLIIIMMQMALLPCTGFALSPIVYQLSKVDFDFFNFELFFVQLYYQNFRIRLIQQIVGIKHRFLQLIIQITDYAGNI